MDKPIFIIGFMGVGKSTQAKKIASKLGYSFVDLDKQIEKLTNRTISEIFSEKGEQYFREIESTTLKKVSSLKVVISTGGGTAVSSENLQFMKEKGIVIWFDCPIEIIVSRVKPSKNTRPLLAKIKDEDLATQLRTLLENRVPFYSQANIKFETSNVNSEKILKLIEEINRFN